MGTLWEPKAAGVALERPLVPLLLLSRYIATPSSGLPETKSQISSKEPGVGEDSGNWSSSEVGDQDGRLLDPETGFFSDHLGRSLE